MLLPEERRRINRLNKSRARAMERRVAQYLKGNRVPMSGSGTLKGDCFVPFDEYRTIYVECKLTQSYQMAMDQKWFYKVQEETKSMRCVFGIFVIHFFGNGGDTVLLSDDAVEKFHALSGIDISEGAEVWEKEYRAKYVCIPREFFRLKPKTWIDVNEGLWLGLPLSEFREHLEEKDRIAEGNN